MAISIAVRLVFISAIIILILSRTKNLQIDNFSQQTWTVREIIPVYLFFAIISLVGLVLSKNIHVGRLYIIASLALTLLAGLILFVFAKIILRKIKASANVLGFESLDIFWYLIFIAIQYSILITFFFSDKDYINILWVLIYISITLVFWPIIEETFYLGMMLIPSSRKLGLKTSVVFVSLLRILIHFDHNLSALGIDFVIVGLLGCYIYVKNKRIIIPILMHSSINFIILIRDLKTLLP